MSGNYQRKLKRLISTRKDIINLVPEYYNILIELADLEVREQTYPELLVRRFKFLRQEIKCKQKGL